MAITPADIPVPTETVTPIKPSEAIRLGCLVAPIQAFGSYGYGKKACALGAMLIGYGVSPTDILTDKRFAKILNSIPKTKCQLCESRLMGCWPPHLNDVHRWSRERIADHLEGLGL